MKTNNIKVLCVLAFAGSVLSLQAQEDKTKEKDLNRQMTLEREFDPTVQDANKVNTLPEVKEPVVKKIPIDYATYTVSTEPAKEITVLPSGKIDTNIDWNKRRGYFNFGAGTYMNINGDAGYHILSTEKDKLNVWFSHRSTNGKVKYLDSNDKVKAKLNDNIGGLNFQHIFTNTILSMGMKYGYSSFNYYGRAFLDNSLYLLSSSYLPDGSFITDPDMAVDRTTNQGAQTIHGYFGMEARNEENFMYKFNFGYTNFSRKYALYKGMDGLKENTVKGDFDFSAGFNGDMRIGLEGDAAYFGYSIPKLNGYEIESYDNHTEVTLAPYYKVNGDSWNIKLGAKAMFSIGDDSKFAFSPNIAADVEVADRTVLYLNAGGNMRANSAAEMSALNRYVTPTAGFAPSRTYLDGILGIKSGIASGFWFDVFGGYNITKDELFFTQGRVGGSETSILTFNNATEVLQMNANKFFAGANLKYSYQDIFEMGLKGVYNNWDVKYKDVKAFAYGKPEFELNANITLRPIKSISASLDYYLATGRNKYNINLVDEKMKNINELNLTGNYTFNDTFGLYLKLNNVLFQKYEIYQGYPLQSFSAMIGVNINF